MAKLQEDNKPSILKRKFICPLCQAIAGHSWHITYMGKSINPPGDLLKRQILRSPNNSLSELDILKEDEASISDLEIIERESELETIEVSRLDYLYLSKCMSCEKHSIWKGKKLVYPIIVMTPPPCEDLPDDVKSIYNEAALILNNSPRAAAALLRLCLEKVCVDLGETHKNLFTKIENLKEAGKIPDTEIFMHFIRKVGNDAIHPTKIIESEGDIDALLLFSMINAIGSYHYSTEKLKEEARRLISTK